MAGTTFANSHGASLVMAPAPVEIPLHDAEPLRLALRVLRESEDIAALAWARGYTKRLGIEAAGDDEPVYSKALMAARLARACVTEGSEGSEGSESGSRAPYFESADAVLDSEALAGDRLAYLYELYEIHRDLVSPMAKTIGVEKLLELAKEMVDAKDPRPFVGLRPGLRWIFTRTLAATLLTFWTSKSPAGGFSAGVASASPETSPSGTTSASDAAP